MSRSEKKCWQFLSGALKALQKLPMREQKKLRKELASILLAFVEARLSWVKSNQTDKEALFKMEEALESLKLFPLKVVATAAQKKTQESFSLGEIAQAQGKKQKGQNKK